MLKMPTSPVMCSSVSGSSHSVPMILVIIMPRLPLATAQCDYFHVHYFYANVCVKSLPKGRLVIAQEQAGELRNVRVNCGVTVPAPGLQKPSTRR
jgi:hypothetical protein